MRKKLVIVGGRGSGQIAMAVFEAANVLSEEWDIAGYLTDIGEPGDRLDNHLILGGTGEVATYVDRGFHIHYALHVNAKKKQERTEKLRMLSLPDEAFATGIHPSSNLDQSASVGFNSLVCALAGTSFGAIIGNHTHLYSSSFLGHDSTTRDFVTLGAHSVVGARVLLGEGTHIGLNATVREDTTIGAYAIVGMAAVVLKDVEPHQIVVGNPARVMSPDI